MFRIAFCFDTIRKDGSVAPRKVPRAKMSFERVLSLMRLRTGLSELDLRSVFVQFAEHLALYLPDGDEIQTPFGTFGLSLKKTRKSRSDSETPAAFPREIPVNRIAFRLLPDRALVRRLRAGTTIEIVEPPALQLPLLFFAQNTDRGVANRGTFGDVLHIAGSRLSFREGDDEQGVFFVDPAGTATRSSSYSRVGSKFVDCKIPPLSPGSYRLEVRTRPHDTEIRAGSQKEPLTIF